MDDVVAYLWRGGRREGGHRRAPGSPITAAAQTSRVLQRPVVWPEVVSPLRHAMGFVDNEARDLNLPKRTDEVAGRESLGRDVQQPALATVKQAKQVAPFVSR